MVPLFIADLAVQERFWELGFDLTRTGR